MTDDQLAHFKQMLLDEKTRLETERRQYAEDDRADMEADASGEMSHADMNNIGDQATDLYDRERNQAAVDNFSRLLSKVDRALAKMGEGTYGLSDLDGTPIPIERLEALPYAALTVAQEEDAVDA